jgi:2Fe-2S ferredoxin
MPQLVVTDRVGRQHTFESETNLTLMEAIRNEGVDGLLALCGGVCSCATCHVHVDPAFANLLPPMSEDENLLLEGSSHRNEYSRLSCQIRLTENLSGLRLTLAEED